MHDELTRILPELQKRVLFRSARVERGIFLTALFFAGLNTLLGVIRAICYAGFAFEGRSVTGLLLETGCYSGAVLVLAFLYNRFHRARSRRTANGLLVAGHLLEKPRLIGEGMLPRRGTGTGAWPVVQDIANVVLGGLGRLLPVMACQADIPVKGKRRKVEIFMFPGESPVKGSNGEVLCFLAPSIWWYPPSPSLLCTASDDPDRDRLGSCIDQALDIARHPGRESRLQIHADG